MSVHLLSDVISRVKWCAFIILLLPFASFYVHIRCFLSIVRVMVPVITALDELEESALISHSDSEKRLRPCSSECKPYF